MGRRYGILLPLVILANLIGAYFGFFIYYVNQLTITPVLLWIFVPDCPLAVLLMAAAFALVWAGKGGNFFPFLAAAYALKYGIWTVSVLLYFNQHFFAPAVAGLYLVMLVTHIGMAVESLAFVGKIRVERWHFVAVLAWFLVNDLMDYWGGLSPNNVPQSGLLFPFTLMLTFVGVPLLYLAYRKGEPRVVSEIIWGK
ncbi:MAG: DUF1405 domain-containing protein [Candidatus ainarchaeum sp.]|nr:DUF1405 domain-containing protein [Candidatus ainarchaeum sp.]